MKATFIVFLTIATLLMLLIGAAVGIWRNIFSALHPTAAQVLDSEAFIAAFTNRVQTVTVITYTLKDENKKEAK